MSYSEKDWPSLIHQAAQLEKWPLAQLISLFENEHPDAIQTRIELQKHFKPYEKKAERHFCIGFTGTPGAGKSSLIGCLCNTFLKAFPKKSVAILAVDPSSARSGGSILGDRTRMQYPTGDKRIFFRSQSSNQELGGISQKTFQAYRVLRHFFDLTLIETVGIGQSEIEVQHLSDHTCLVMQPLAGDQIQFMKSGIMEIPDTFIINKCDETSLAQQSYHLLQSSLRTSKIWSDPSEEAQKIFLTSATRQRGIDELLEHCGNLIETGAPDAYQRKESYYYRRWIKEFYGQYGLRYYEKHVARKKGFEELLYEEKQLDLQKSFESQLAKNQKSSTRKNT